MNFLKASVIVFLLASVSLAQQKGSVEAYRAAANADRIVREAKLSWQQSTRLGYAKDAHEEPRISLAESQFAEGTVGFLEEYNFTAGSVLNASEVLVECGSMVLLLRGYPTTGIVTEQKVRLIGPVRFNGTFTYNSLDGGAVTVRVVEFLKDAELRKHQEEAAAAEEAKQYRTYTDSTGKFTFEGKFIEYKSGKAFIERRDNKKVLELELSKLSRTDGDYIRGEIKARKEAADAAKKAARGKQ